jgi:hypothetical protein
VHPLDLTRTRLGVDLGRSLAERQFRGMNDALVKIYGMDGVRGLYYGLPITIVGIFIYRGLYFGVYDSGKDLLMTGCIQLSISFNRLSKIELSIKVSLRLECRYVFRDN